MQRMRMASALLGLLILTSGCATCRTPLCSKPRACKPCKTNCDNGDCGTDKCERGPLVPFRNACQDREFSHNFLGRIGRWMTYRPLCAETPCDCGDTPRCHPPLYTYFTPSPYNRTYEPVPCGGGACRPSWFGGIFGKRSCGSCGSCDDSCSSCRSCWTLKITLPRISFTRDCGDCTTPVVAPKCENGCKDNVCGTRCMTLPRPISNRACENSSAGCNDKEKACGSGRCGLGLGFGGGLRERFFGGCGACGLRCRLGNNVNNKCCSSTPNVSNVDVNHLPILPPNAVTDVKPGEIEKVPKADPFGGPKVPDEALPGTIIE